MNCEGATGALLSTRPPVERGLQFLQKDAFAWKASRKCAACHHAATMLWTFNEAKRRGYPVDEAALNEVTDWAFGDMKTNSVTDQPPPRDVLNLGWVYVLLSMETAPAFRALKPLEGQTTPVKENGGVKNQVALLSARQTLLNKIVEKQDADGSWGRPLDQRVPLGGPVEDIAILARLALLESGDRSESVTEGIRKAGGWLTANRDKTSRQGRNLRLLMDVYEGKPQSQLVQVITSIRSEENADGGWSQTPEMASDAYATGQTLYVLARAGVPPEAPELRRGVSGSHPTGGRFLADDLQSACQEPRPDHGNWNGLGPARLAAGIT